MSKHSIPCKLLGPEAVTRATARVVWTGLADAGEDDEQAVVRQTASLYVYPFAAAV